ncbi:hypothetical protein K437DRAFT_77898 [Tilletiaria anomala UBC 951]|uniref:Uncharacterized protein n=1 Tax=Tilletiaria anomala (strain ATCC 24038 / CBS 436.72 / UBC 951) TaxID=1037660 RepID=A0A066V1B0_TILAU|nr:uncharacterized protein K437DRAFT_77898 [Tilletiaria anomala UBC 951]KDN35487.1 hypothetical protein K437DRAFT_77898 [Tilletiaria anomala UBC 951]
MQEAVSVCWHPHNSFHLLGAEVVWQGEIVSTFAIQFEAIRTSARACYIFCRALLFSSAVLFSSSALFVGCRQRLHARGGNSGANEGSVASEGERRKPFNESSHSQPRVTSGTRLSWKWSSQLASHPGAQEIQAMSPPLHEGCTLFYADPWRAAPVVISGPCRIVNSLRGYHRGWCNTSFGSWFGG